MVCPFPNLQEFHRFTISISLEPPNGGVQRVGPFAPW